MGRTRLVNSCKCCREGTECKSSSNVLGCDAFRLFKPFGLHTARTSTSSSTHAPRTRYRAVAANVSITAAMIQKEACMCNEGACWRDGASYVSLHDMSALRRSECAWRTSSTAALQPTWHRIVCLHRGRISAALATLQTLLGAGFEASVHGVQRGNSMAMHIANAYCVVPTYSVPGYCALLCVRDPHTQHRRGDSDLAALWTAVCAYMNKHNSCKGLDANVLRPLRMRAVGTPQPMHTRTSTTTHACMPTTNACTLVHHHWWLVRIARWPLT